MHTRWAQLRLFLLILCFCMFIHICSFFGLIDILRQKSFAHFTYPLEINLVPVVKRLRQEWRPNTGKSIDFGIEKQVQPINTADFPYIIRNKNRCGKGSDPDMMVLVKTAVSHQKHRSVLRRTWMNAGLYRRAGFKFCAIFLLGVDKSESSVNLEAEQRVHGDLVQFNFVDSYFNNTYKTMLGFRWAIENVPKVRYLFFTDDDYYVNIWNLWQFISSLQNPRVIAGFIWDSSMPKRFRYSKWHISLEEYPYVHWPRYPTAGSYVMSMDTALDLYIGMHFTKYLRFDDVFVGIVAHKLNIPTLHNTSFFGSPLFPIHSLVYKNVIACHMLGSPELVLEAWRNTMKYSVDKGHL